jgi:hypothetical protein
MNEYPPITIDDLTTNEIEGSGVFDELMRSVKAHLKEEFEQGRITPVNYSSVYLGALDSTLAQSVKFLLEKDKISLENELVEEQKANLIKQGVILDLEAEKLRIDVYNAKYQECILKTTIEKEEAGVQGALQANANEKTKASLLTKQIAKSDAETRLFNQKRNTELAQVVDKIDGVSIGGVIGIQREMYRNQSNGFLRLAEQQNARMMLDAFSVLQSNAGLDAFQEELREWGVTATTVSLAINTMAAGVDKQSGEHGVKNDTVIGNMPSSNYSEILPTEPVAPTTCPVVVPPITP